MFPVSDKSTTDDVLADRYRRAFDKIKRSREQWIEGTLELAQVMKTARLRYPNHHDYSRWIERYGLQEINQQDRAALKGFADDLTAARALLESTRLNSWQHIWGGRPNKPNRPMRAPSQPRKGTHSKFQQRSGAQHRRRRNQLPTVMQADNPRPERKAVNLKVLSREQVDPDFKGTEVQFATEYGHVNLHTKAEIAHHKKLDALQKWLGFCADLDRAAREMIAAFAKVDHATMQAWLGKSGRADKMKTWRKNAQSACEQLREIID